jgi:hypothetical protein
MSFADKKIRYALLGLIPIIIGLACNLPSTNFTVPEEETSIISTQAVEELITNVGTVVEDIQNGESFNLIVTEAQLTSIINYELQSYQEYNFRDVQVFLRDGVVKISGQAEQNNIALPLTLTFSVYPDASGVPQYDILSAKIGPFDLPTVLVDQLTIAIDTAFQTNFLPIAQQVVVETIIIDEGLMNISGYTK